MALSSNTILQGRYRIIRQLGQGGMGTVYEAIDQRLKSIVAIKENLTNSGHRAFEREASLLANLRHPSLPKVVDHFTEQKGQFLVMEFIAGTDLAQLLNSRSDAFPPDEVLRWGDTTLSILEYLHTRNPPILHRDIKPSNLKLTTDGELFLLDFGFAKGSAGQMSTIKNSKSIRGFTPVYASLEQIQGKGSDVRSDIYSLAATLYHLITGVMPVDALTRATAIINGESDPLSQVNVVNNQVPVEVASILHRAMSLQRERRFSSATEMRRVLMYATNNAQQITTTGKEPISLLMRFLKLKNIGIAAIILILFAVTLIFFYLSEHTPSKQTVNSNEKAPIEQPISAEQHYKDGMELIGKEKFAEAEAEFEKAVKLEPNNTVFLIMYGVSLEQQITKRSKALEVYRSVLSIDPNNENAISNIVSMYTENNFGDPDEVLELAERNFRNDPDFLGAIDLLGWVYYKRGRNEEAVELFQKALVRGYKISSIHFRLGLALARKGDKKGARRELEEALNLGGLTPIESDEARYTLKTLQ